MKERLGDKIEHAKVEAKSKAEARRAALTLDNEPIVPNPERKVFVGSSDRKRDRSRHEVCYLIIDILSLVVIFFSCFSP